MARTLKDAIIQAFVKNAILDYLANVRKDRAKMTFLSGYRTYIIAALSLVLVALHFLGINIPGVDYQAVGEIGALIAVFFARKGGNNDSAKALAVSSQISVASAKDVIATTGK